MLWKFKLCLLNHTLLVDSEMKLKFIVTVALIEYLIKQFILCLNMAACTQQQPPIYAITG